MLATNRSIFVLSYLCASVFICGQFLYRAVCADDVKPKIAVFPLGGSASADDRDKVGFSLRMKLDRDGHYEPIDGPTMGDLVGDKVIDLAAKPDDLAAISKDESPAVLVWGELNTAAKGFDLKIKIRDLRQAQSAIEIDKAIAQPTDLRFVIEQILQNISGVGKFGHPVENAVTDDAKSAALWAKNPDLAIDGDFAKSGSWMGILRSEKYPAPLSDSLPEPDKVVIYQKAGHNVLAMNLSKDVAESNGLACLSAPILIEANMRYRLQFKYQSDKPALHVFVKGYIRKKDISGEMADLQSYECQVPPSGATDGKWKTVVCDINPQNVSGSPTFLKIDLYAYLYPGRVMFDDVQLKAVGEMTRHAVDDAIKPPAP